MTMRKRRGTPEEWFHCADGRIPVVQPPASPDEPVNGPAAIRKVCTALCLWMICPLARCRRARLCLTHKDLAACQMANREALRPHFQAMRAAVDRAVAGRQETG
jgi:hypothetical protein